MTIPTTDTSVSSASSATVPTIGDVFSIPRAVHQGDFVLRLTEGVDASHAEATLRDYVVTPQLQQCFKDALDLLRGALEANTSRAAYLHGSFGSGKSHFMAVLSLLLDGDPRARAIPDLAPVVSENRGWLGQRKMLVVPMHLINAPSLEAAIFGQYARFVRERHPDAPTPGFYRAEQLFADARSLRDNMGDANFFARLSDASKGDGGWGALGGGWDAPSFEAALNAQPGDAERARLVGDLVETFFTSVAGLAGTNAEGFVAIDEGLVVLTQHAQALGYDGVVLFLDEVMLWLASHAADSTFLGREAQKLVTLVETANMRRPIPIVAFLARQRDLRQLVGEHLVGAEQQAIEDVLRYWEGRFATIKLEDRNLPAIIERRLLRPVSAEAKAKLDEAHTKSEAVRAEVLSVLLTREGDRAQFRQLYPFSPVLVQALVALSSLLQRERTALKLLVQLLVIQRDTLAVGDIMPVGELWAVLADGTEQPFSATVRERFEQARRLWRQRLLPLLEEERSANVAAGATPEAAEQQSRNDQRLLATLVLSALAEGVEALDGLTPTKLAALNHGTVRARIPGQEARMVLDKLRRWAGRVGEIKLVESGSTQTVSLHLVGVDTDVIIENAKAADSMGARVQKVRSILFDLASIPAEDALVLPVRTVRWRGTERRVEVLFNNVRGMAPEQFRPSGQAPWRMVIDYPFDEPGQSPINDRAAILQAKSGGTEALSVVWLPAFLTPAAQDELGKLVVLDFLLAGSQLDAHASHLSALDRSQAKEILKSQRDALRVGVINALLSAYGITTQFRDRIDESHGLDTNLFTLASGLTLVPPVGANFSDALDHVMGQAFVWQYPAHPTFEGDVKPAGLKKVWTWVQKAAQQPAARVEVDRTDRDDMRRLGVPLGLGAMGDAHFVLQRNWEQHFAKCQAQDGVTPLTVGRVRGWIDQPKAMGLPREAENLVILTWALQTDRSFHLFGSSGAVEGTVDRLLDDYEVRTQTLPDENTWRSATRRAAELFGLAAPAHLSAQNVALLSKSVGEKHLALRVSGASYAQTLDTALSRLSVEPGTSERRATAQAARDLLTSLEGQNAEGIIRALAAARIPTSATALGEALTRGADLAATLARIQWPLVKSMGDLPRDTFGARVDALLDGLREALRNDEHVRSLDGAVEHFNTEGLHLVTESARLIQEEQTRLRRDDDERRRVREEEERIKRAAEEAVMQAERERLRADQERLAREREVFDRASLERKEQERREREAAVRQPDLVKESPRKQESRTVAAAKLEEVLTQIRRDVEGADDADVEITWQLLPKHS
jgi:hypothetical protein